MMTLNSGYAGWYCHEVASERNGDVINACGIAEASDEDVARKLALENARKELLLICSLSADCVGKDFNVTPLRTECKLVGSVYRCHRGISAEILAGRNNAQEIVGHGNVYVPKNIIQSDGSKSLQETSIVEFETSPPGATLYIDGVEVCVTPCTQEVEQGEHKILYEKPNFDFVSRVFLIDSGKQQIKQVLTDSYGYLTISGLPEQSVVKIDNKTISLKDGVRLTPNEHVVSVESAYHQVWFKKFQIQKGERLNISYDAEPLKSYLKISALDSRGRPLEARIKVDDKNLSSKTPAVLTLPAGKRFILLSSSGHKNVAFEMELEASQKYQIKKTLELSHEKDWTTYVGLGIGSSPYRGFKESKNPEYTCCLILDLSLQRYISDNIALRATYNNLSGSVDEKKVNFSLAPSQEYRVTSSSGSLFSVSLPIYAWKTDRYGYYLAPEYGVFSGSVELKRDLPLGTVENKFHQRVGGVMVGGDWIKETDSALAFGAYLMLGLRKFYDTKLKNGHGTATQEQTNPVKGAFMFYITGGVAVAF